MKAYIAALVVILAPAPLALAYTARRSIYQAQTACWSLESRAILLLTFPIVFRPGAFIWRSVNLLFGGFAIISAKPLFAAFFRASTAAAPTGNRHLETIKKKYTRATLKRKSVRCFHKDSEAKNDAASLAKARHSCAQHLGERET